MYRLLKTPDRVIENFTKAESQLYENFRVIDIDISNENITTLSEKMFCSPSTIVAFLKKLGYSGFKEFKYVFESYKTLPRTEAIVENAVFDQIIEKNLVEMKNSISKISVGQITKICEDIKNAENILIVSNEITNFVANEFKYKLQMLGMNVTPANDRKQMYVLLKSKKFDYIITFSLFGNTEQIIKAFEETNTIGDLLITSNQTAYLNKYNKQKLLVSRSDNSMIDKLNDENIDIHSRLGLSLVSRIIIDNYIAKYLI